MVSLTCSSCGRKGYSQSGTGNQRQKLNAELVHLPADLEKIALIQQNNKHLQSFMFDKTIHSRSD